MADENDIALGVVKIAQANGGLCTFVQAYQQIPKYVKLSAANLAASNTRHGEPMWYQLVRNIKSHDKNPGNFIHDGYLIHVPDIGYKIP